MKLRTKERELCLFVGFAISWPAPIGREGGEMFSEEYKKGFKAAMEGLAEVLAFYASMPNYDTPNRQLKARAAAVEGFVADFLRQVVKGQP